MKYSSKQGFGFTENTDTHTHTQTCQRTIGNKRQPPLSPDYLLLYLLQVRVCSVLSSDNSYREEGSVKERGRGREREIL